MGELAPDRRADLRDFPGRAEPVEPCHQRGMQACRDRQGWRRTNAGSARRFAFAFRLQHRLRHFLDEQRNAVGARGDLGHHIRTQLFVPGEACDHDGHLALPKPIERQARDMRLPDPGRSELGPEGDDEQHRNAVDELDSLAQPLKACRIGPMSILENRQQCVLA